MIQTLLVINKRKERNMKKSNIKKIKEIIGTCNKIYSFFMHILFNL